MKNFTKTKEQIIEDFFSRRFTNYYSWMMEEVDQRGGLMTLGRIAILGGAHASGKSTYITELAKHNSLSKKTMLIPLEMGEEFTVMTLACNLFNKKKTEEMDALGYGEVEEGYLYQRPDTEKELFKKCVEEIYSKYPQLYIRQPEDLTFENLKELILKGREEENIKFFIIDHLHQLSVNHEMSETAFYSMVAKELALLAKEIKVALLCVVQLTKAANASGATMDLSAFKGTSEFTSNAHRVVLIKKPTYHTMTATEAKKVLKHRGMIDTKGEINNLISQDEMQFETETENIRELAFLKTRGRQGGTVTIEMHKGEFKFHDYGPYKKQPLRVELRDVKTTNS